MAFTIFTDSTTADATEVMDNWYHIWQGDRMPMSGTSMTAVNNTYDIGASATAWETLYCDTLHVTNYINTKSATVWNLIDEFNLTATTSSIEFTGLNGDAYEQMVIISRWNGQVTTTGHQIYLYLNSDSVTNYGHQRFYGQGAVAGAVRDTSEAQIFFNTLYKYTTTSDNSFNRAILYSKTGYPRLLLNDRLADAGQSYVNALYQYAFIWSNSTATITSLKFVQAGGHDFLTGTSIELWGRK